MGDEIWHNRNLALHSQPTLTIHATVAKIKARVLFLESDLPTLITDKGIPMTTS